MVDDKLDTEKAAKKLAERLRKIADVVETDVLSNNAGSFSESLVETLEAVVAKEFSAIAILMVGKELLVDDWVTTDVVPPSAVFELAGRLQGMATRLSMIATHEERLPEEDHTGHGCPHDPEVKKTDSN